MSQIIDFRVDPNNYRHWRVEYDGAIANLYMDVDEDGGLFDGYQLKLNSYDLGVDIELERHSPTDAFRTSRSKSCCNALSKGQSVLRRSQYSDVGRGRAQSQGEFLQIHE